MEMTERTIKDKYVRRGVTIKILAELNACSEEYIRGILMKQGVTVPEKRERRGRRKRY